MVKGTKQSPQKRKVFHWSPDALAAHRLTSQLGHFEEDVQCCV